MSRPDQWEEVNRILLQALERDADQWDSFLDEACRDKPELRREVASLLAADPETITPLDGPFLELLHSPLEPLAEERLGPYRVVQEIDRGGTGAIYLAVDEKNDEQVAIKVLKRGMDTAEILRRFCKEREILANLKHPNIAAFKDTGSTRDDRPYLVMEYVDGEPIDQYCDRRRLSVRRRVELFTKVCTAVQFAHQNLVIHRDLKPTNILVNAKGEPKLLDFGIAKLLDPNTLRPTTDTMAVLRPMTVEYASPEQIQGLPLTTATDVYSLGVVLFELLTGHYPYRFGSGFDTGAWKAICEQEPLAPSAALWQREERRTPRGEQTIVLNPKSVSIARGCDPRKLQKQLTGDLDKILLMALRKSPQRRYLSAEQLGQDLKNYLREMPVFARKDTFLYRTRKFAQRHYRELAVVSLIAGLLTAFSVDRELQQRRTAAERDKAQQVSAFLTDLFAVSGAEFKPVGFDNLSAREFLDLGAQKIDNELADQPDLRASMMLTIGTGYHRLGYHQEAEPMLEGALRMRRAAQPQNELEIIKILDELAGLKMGTGDYQQAESLFRESLNLKRRILGEEAPQTLDALASVATILMEQGHMEEAERLLRQVLSGLEATTGRDHSAYAAASGNLAILLYYKGEYEESESLYRQAIDISSRVLGRQHPQVTANMQNLASLMLVRGEFSQAEALYGDTLEIYKKATGAESHSIATVLYNLARVKLAKGAVQAAEQKIVESLAMRRRLEGGTSLSEANALVVLARVHLAQNKTLLAEEAVLEALDILRQTLDIDHWRLAYAEAIRGICLLQQGDFSAAETLLLDGYQALHQSIGLRATLTRNILERLVELYEAWGRPKDAQPYRALLNDPPD